jgi:hypothetical protein
MITTRLVQLGAPVLESTSDVVSAAPDEEVSVPELDSDDDDVVDVVDVLGDDVDEVSPSVSGESVASGVDSSLAPPPHAHSENASCPSRTLMTPPERSSDSLGAGAASSSSRR